MCVRLLCWVAGLCLASAAQAQGERPLVLYGVAHAMMEWVEVRGDKAPPNGRARVTDQSSRLGLRGTEDFGGGLSAWFQLETNFAVDSNSTTFANRNSGIGFLGPWGTFVAGRWKSAFEASQVGYVDPFADTGLSGIQGAAINQGNFARRDANVIQYWSPRLDGWRTRMNYQLHEGATAGAKPHDYAANFSYLDEKTYLALAYEKHKDQVGNKPTAGADEDGRGASGFHYFGRHRVFAQYGLYRRTGTAMQRSFMVGFAAVHEAHELLGSYQHSRDGGAVGLPAQPRCDILGAGYRYRLSLRTFFLAEYTRVNNHVGALCNFGANRLAISAGQDLRGMAAGIRTVF